MLLFNNIDVDWSFYDDMHFNTSNVTIQPYQVRAIKEIKDFNTSNVTIQQI